MSSIFYLRLFRRTHPRYNTPVQLNYSTVTPWNTDHSSSSKSDISRRKHGIRHKGIDSSISEHSSAPRTTTKRWGNHSEPRGSTYRGTRNNEYDQAKENLYQNPRNSYYNRENRKPRQDLGNSWGASHYMERDKHTNSAPNLYSTTQSRNYPTNLWSGGNDGSKPMPSRSSWSSPKQKKHFGSRNKERHVIATHQVELEDVVEYFEENVDVWVDDPQTTGRLISFGLDAPDIRPLLNAFSNAIRRGDLSDEAGFEKYGLVRFSQPFTITSVGIIYNTIFFAWAAELPAEEIQLNKLSRRALDTLRRIAEAGDRRYISEEFPLARRFHRKVIMHVGPTNSGKTHNALRALAAAEIGVYAGPLRLLAHEIWERLNLGQIVPLGVEEAPPKPSQLNQESALDVMTATTAANQGWNPQYARPCNMRTGEEQKIVGDNVTLLSCTVEMLNLNVQYDVAVVDEIQMISDSQRGFAWTSAVLGLPAKELHLCGEETAVPIVQALLKDTGDELIVNHYERLTPLIVEEKSLEGDLANVRKGDCLVTFRRSSIFAIKRQVEEKTGMRCAVVYGKLPPEIRSEQAALFNNPDSGYDIIVASDAIGMGLNLKIRRVIFTDVAKMDNNGRHVHLSSSAIKQIAGRAGRYGMHGDGEPGGFTTTLRPADLPFLKKQLAVPPAPLQFARITPDSRTFTSMMNILPSGSLTETIYNAHMYAARLSPVFRYTELPRMHEMCRFIDMRKGDMTGKDRLMFTMAPVPWGDEKCLNVMDRFLSLYRTKMSVDFMEAIKGTHFLATLEEVEAMMAKKLHTPTTTNSLTILESFHKVVVLYMWLSFRNPVVYSSYEEVTEIKGRLERGLEWCLQGISYVKHPELSSTPGKQQKPVIPYRTKVSARNLVDQKLAPAAEQSSLQSSGPV